MEGKCGIFTLGREVGLRGEAAVFNFPLWLLLLRRFHDNRVKKKKRKNYTSRWERREAFCWLWPPRPERRHWSFVFVDDQSFRSWTNSELRYSDGTRSYLECLLKWKPSRNNIRIIRDTSPYSRNRYAPKRNITTCCKLTYVVQSYQNSFFPFFVETKFPNIWLKKLHAFWPKAEISGDNISRQQISQILKTQRILHNRFKNFHNTILFGKILRND